jgi:sugar lactone lactonase YvrE
MKSTKFCILMSSLLGMPLLLPAQQAQFPLRLIIPARSEGVSNPVLNLPDQTKSTPKTFELAQTFPLGGPLTAGGQDPGRGGVGQPGLQYPFTLGTNTMNVSSNSGTAMVELAYSAAADQAFNAAGGSVSSSWTATTNASWLHVPAGSALGTGSGVVQLTYDVNPDPEIRSGTVTIAGLLLVVNQAAAGTTQVVAVTTLIPSSSGLTSPQGIATNGSGDFYIADGGANAILQWNVVNGQISTLVPGLNEPLGVAVDNSEHVFIADTLDEAIRKWNPINGLQTLVGSGLNNPTGVAIDSGGNVYFADTANSTIREIPASSQQVTTLVSSGLNYPFALAVDALQNVYIADTGNNAIKQYNANTGQLGIVATGLNNPTGIAVDGQGNVYFANAHQFAIEMWSPQTGQTTSLAYCSKRTDGLALDWQGNVYFSESLQRDVKEISFLYMPLNVTEAASAGTDSVQVLSTANLVPTSDQSWLTIDQVDAGVITFSFQANLSTSSRTAHITVLGQQITITQQPASGL